MRTLLGFLITATLTAVFACSATAQPPGFGGGGFFGGGGMTRLVTNKSVLTEIKATDEQKEKLTKWSREASEKRMERMAEFRPAEGEQPDFAKMQEAMEKINKEQDEALAKLIEKDQFKRIKQIQLQTQNIAAFRQKDVQDKLKLSDEQKEDLQTIQREYFEEFRESGIFGQPGDEPPTPEQMAERQKKMSALGKKYVDKIVGKFKDDQKKTWEEMIGKTFDYKPEPPPMRRGN